MALLLCASAETFAAGRGTDSGSRARHESPARNPLGEQVALGLIDTVLLFDHLFMHSSTAVSSDYLQRMAEPRSRYHAAYLQYRNRQMSARELVARLPHVALIGDSLSKDMYVSSVPSTFWRARTRRGHDWYLDTDANRQSIYSVFERMQKITPLVATEYSGAGAQVDAGTTPASFVRQLVRTRNFAGQVDQLLKARRFPDLVLVWIGHNNLDWAADIGAQDRQSFFGQRAKTFRENYQRQVERLIERAAREDHKVAIVVYGLVNFDAFFKARAQAEALHAQNRKLYPYLEIDYQHYRSMRPEYRAGMIKLALMYNAQLREMARELNGKCPPNVQVRYSNAMAEAKIDKVELIHAMDAWHPSVKGHNVLAQSAFDGLRPSLQFLGIDKEAAKPR